MSRDEGKPRYTLIPLASLQPVARIAEHGARKHNEKPGEQAWRGVDRLVFVDKLVRHVLAYERGEHIDPDSGEPHLAAAVFDALVLIAKDGDAK